jgi:hypothetical protein
MMPKSSQKLLSILLVGTLLGLCLLSTMQARSLKQQIVGLERSVSRELRKIAEHVPVLVTNQQVRVTETVIMVTNSVVTNVVMEVREAYVTNPVVSGEVDAQEAAEIQRVATNLHLALKTSRIEAEEAQTAVKQLLKQQDRLLQEKLDYQKQVARLSASLARMQAEFDRQLVRDESAEVGPSVRVATKSNRSLFDGRVSDFQGDLNMVILDIGAESGVKSGMQFSLVQEGQGIGRVRVIDVRPGLSGAVIEILKETEEPLRGIRVIPYKNEDSDGS